MLKEFKRPDDGLDKEQRKDLTGKYQDHITERLQDIKSSKIPTIVIIEGWDAAGKGKLLNELISKIDPRFYTVYVEESYKDGGAYPFLYPYFNALPENGKFRFYESAYMDRTVHDCLNGNLSARDYEKRINSINGFERTIINNGYRIVKFFVNISAKEQSKRFKAYLSDPDNSWRVSESDLRQNQMYSMWRKAYDAFMEDTSVNAPWHILDGEKSSVMIYDAFRILSDSIDASIAEGKYNGPAYEERFEMSPVPMLKDVDMSVCCASDEEYKAELKKQQKRVNELQYRMIKERIPMVIAFEGWDAAGKGGAIRRLAYPLDPRDFVVYPIASPDQYELARHFLWRFYIRLPRAGNTSIFDRTWYGRVMVERLEGYCSENDWQRAYNEINEFEQDLADWGAVVLKFWIQIDPDTQLERFNDRQNTPEKQWKITDEDWRNREKWDLYEEAIDEMLQKTSTKTAPWHIVESVDKRYARIKVLKITADAMEEALNEHERKSKKH